MNLDNTKIHTTDPEVIRKYAELCGKPFFDQGIKTKGWFNGEHQPKIYNFVERCDIDYDNDIFATINPNQINALYDEKFGKVETPEEAEAFESMAQDNEQLQNYEMGDLRPVIDVDGKLYTADDVRALLSLQDLPASEWKNGDVCDYKNEDDEWESNGRYVCFDSFAEHHVFCANNMGMYHAASDQIRKPETPQQREERERLEAVEAMCELLDKLPIGGFYEDMEKLYDAGYRKQ